MCIRDRVQGVSSGSGSSGPPRGACSKSVQHTTSPGAGTEPGSGTLPRPIPPVSRTTRPPAPSYATNSPGCGRPSGRARWSLVPAVRCGVSSVRTVTSGRGRGTFASVYSISTSVTGPAKASPASRRSAITSGSSNASWASSWAWAVSRVASLRAAVTASSRRGCGGSPARTRSRCAVYDQRSRRQRSATWAPSGRARSRSRPRQTASQVGRSCAARSSRIAPSAAASSARADAKRCGSASRSAVRARS